MLNELAELSESLLAVGVQAHSWHRHFKTLPKSRTLRLLLNDAGQVEDIEPITDSEHVQAIRKWEVAAGVSFPAFNVNPLFHTTSGEAKTALKEFYQRVKNSGQTDAEAVEKLFARIQSVGKPLWELDDAESSEAERLKKCLRSHPSQLLGILGETPQELQAVTEVIDRIQKLDPARLFDAIRSVAIRKIVQQPESAKQWIESAIVSTAKTVKKICLVCEAADSAQFAYPANHPKAQAWINQKLLEAEQRTDQPQTTGTDAYGHPSEGTNEKYPSVKLPVLGNFSIRAMNSESPCQFRYGFADENSFPVGRRLRQRMKDALEWLGDRSRRRMTWQDVSGACGFTRTGGGRAPVAALLFAYPSALPPAPPELAGLFGGEDELSDPDGARFEACAARVTPALEGIVREVPHADVRVFVLTKPDGYRAKVLVSRRFAAKHLLESATEWHQSCRNIPTIRLNLGTRDSPRWITPLTPFPLELTKCMNVTWEGEGTRANPAHGLAPGEGLLLLLDTGTLARGTVERAMRLALTNATPLLLAVGHADHRRDGSFKLEKKSAGYAKHMRLWPSIFGLLLFKTSSMKGEYMHSAPFLVGRMLALADTLHREYCTHVRKTKVPPQLLGNATMMLAMENPTAGLARLAERLAPYQSWANTATGDGLGLAKWTLGEMGKVSNHLATLALAAQCDDAAKAQMLLGYLARPERDEGSRNDSANFENSQNAKETNDGE
jgi:hypothetical protein